MGRKPAETEITQLGKKSTITIEWKELGQAESCDLGWTWDLALQILLTGP